MQNEVAETPLAPPCGNLFHDHGEANWAFDFLRHMLDILNAAANDYRPCVLTLPKGYRSHLLRFNFGPWLLLDYCGPQTKYGKHIHLALIADNTILDPRQKWFTFNYPHDWQGVAIYKFSWPEIQFMDAELTAHFEASMHYTGELFNKWKGSPYRLAHQPKIFAAILHPQARAELFENGTSK